MKIEQFLSQSIVFSLMKSAHVIEKSMMSKLASYEVTPNQALILVTIFFENRAVHPIELANALEMTKANVSHCTAILEEKKLIKRSTKVQDRRLFEISLTENGIAKISELVAFFDKQQQLIEKELGITAAETILEQLSNFKRILKMTEQITTY